MKKIIAMILVLLVLAGCSKNKEGRFSRIYSQTCRKMIEEKQSFVLYVGADSCDKCAQYREILIKLFESNPMTVYYIDMDREDEHEFKDLVYNYLYRCEVLPTTYIIKEGNREAIKEEIIELGDLKLWLLENGIIG